MKRRIFALFLPVALAIAMALPAFGAGCTLTVDMGEYGPMLEGAVLSLYLVGNEEDKGIRLVGDFSGSGLVLSEENLPYGADLLANYVREQGLTGREARVGPEGNVTYQGVLPGIWLLVQKEKTPDDVTAIPFLIRVTREDTALTAYPKVTIPNVTVEPDLPQTGTLRWLIPVLMIPGFGILAVGLWLRYKEE